VKAEIHLLRQRFIAEKNNNREAYAANQEDGKDGAWHQPI